MRRKFITYSIVSLCIVAVAAYFWLPVLWVLAIIIPLILCGVYDMMQTRHTLWRNFPLVGRGRWIMEMLRPPLHQYFVESDIEGVPINRMFRSVVYQRAKKALDTVPFGTRVDVYRVGYEWMDHSLAAIHSENMDPDPRVTVGGPDCSKQYNASIFNISAMSFGALSKNAILALNGGALIGGFIHNTGEGGISPYHLEKGGDLVWQIGTGYFGCRTKDGKFSPELFREKAALDQVKMIELKLSQGAKPGHGGILPAVKNTPEIAAIRGVKPHTQVDSPPVHSAFSNPLGMMKFIQKLRELSGGKPVGFKLCLGRRSEFVAICKAMSETNIRPDFITVDGGEGGTGAAPLEYSNSVGVPLRDGLAFVTDILTGFDLKKDIKVIASGKILSGFHLIKNIALGADICSSARGMMLALGCIQALECNQNTCPTGITTQNSEFTRGLVVADKEKRVANYHGETVKTVVELLAASGLDSTGKLTRSHIHRRDSATTTKRYDEIYPYVTPGRLLEAPYPARFEQEMQEANSCDFAPGVCVAFYGPKLKKVME
jgi:glutamate synthase domain-containing protein 2